ncbi:MAG: hypothetical protein GY870_13730 [archaeon]|nr:hypothetical protein [archaeon]
MTNNKFEEIRMVDNFYQTSSFFPMPVIAITTFSENGMINIGPYSLCFPFYVVGKDYYSMMLNCRNNSNTARNLLRTKKCALNFIEDDKKILKNCVQLGFPGDKTEDKMKESNFTLVPSSTSGNPDIIEEAFQVFECTWQCNLDGAENDSVQDEYKPPFHDFNGITSRGGAHFVLKIDKILLKPKHRSSIVDGVKSSGFPKIPIDYGYRDNINFWFSRYNKVYSEPIPKNKGVGLDVVKYAAERMDPDVKFTDEACGKLTKVPRIFLKMAVKGCVDWAKENDVTVITEEHMDIIRNKRSQEKS